MSKSLGLVVAVALAIVGTATVLRADPAPGRSRWEYKAEALPADTKDADVPKVLETRLAALTAEGWEYAGWVPAGHTLVLRRAR